MTNYVLRASPKSSNSSSPGYKCSDQDQALLDCCPEPLQPKKLSNNFYKSNIITPEFLLNPIIDNLSAELNANENEDVKINVSSNLYRN